MIFWASESYQVESGFEFGPAEASEGRHSSVDQLHASTERHRCTGLRRWKHHSRCDPFMLTVMIRIIAMSSFTIIVMLVVLCALSLVCMWQFP